ncbi:MAG: hypothetical protein JOS17DRAFT_757291 [Linnemannia elongata]|nr:MAG: hypothetical protein JOS17DRAFT_757291 [Linnemannia elongata]
MRDTPFYILLSLVKCVPVNIVCKSPLMKSTSSLFSLLFFYHFTCLVCACLLVVHPAISSATPVCPQANKSFYTTPTLPERLLPPPLSPPSLPPPPPHPPPQPQLIHQPQQQLHKLDSILQESVPTLQYQYPQTQPLLPNSIKDNGSNHAARATNGTVTTIGDDHHLARGGEGGCAEDDCQAQSDACHQRSILACQQARRRGSCREKFARRCRMDYLDCIMHCILSDPDSDPYPSGYF